MQDPSDKPADDFVWPETCYVIERADGGVQTSFIEITGETGPREYLLLFTDDDLAQTFVQETGVEGRSFPKRWFKELPDLLQRVQSAGIERVAVDPSPRQQERAFQWRLVSELLNEFRHFTIPCFVLMDPRPGRFYFLSGRPRNYVGIFSSMERFSAYIQAASPPRAVCGTMTTPKQMADYLRTIPQDVANAYLIDPVHGVPNSGIAGPLSVLIERLDEF